MTEEAIYIYDAKNDKELEAVCVAVGRIFRWEDDCGDEVAVQNFRDFDFILSKNWECEDISERARAVSYNRVVCQENSLSEIIPAEFKEDHKMLSAIARAKTIMVSHGKTKAILMSGENRIRVSKNMLPIDSLNAHKRDIELPISKPVEADALVS
jgi:hypothetical protein